MPDLKSRIVERIEETGPLSVADYMAICLFDPVAGYYTTREPFGAQGDFTTAPEISQMFGELVAVWLYTAWKTAGAPDDAIIAEIGPGHGTLMRDMLRSWSRLDPSFTQENRIAMIEASPRLTEVQRSTIGEASKLISWHPDLRSLADAPLFIVGNELFDALPIRQFVKTGTGWQERVVGLDDAGDLAFRAGPATLEQEFLPADALSAPEGSIVEFAPARTALMDEIAHRIALGGGAALFIDYGYVVPGIGDTFQAMRKHRYADVLADPGAADLTAHVDFASLAQAARRHGLKTRLLDQGDFLIGLGLLERAGQLGSTASDDIRQRLQGEVQRLAAPEEMGTLFKVLMVHSPDVDLPPAAP